MFCAIFNLYIILLRMHSLPFLLAKKMFRQMLD